jgi:hypothetical protein
MSKELLQIMGVFNNSYNIVSTEKMLPFFLAHMKLMGFSIYWKMSKELLRNGSLHLLVESSSMQLKTFAATLEMLWNLANKATLFVNSITSYSKTSMTSDGRIVEPNFIHDLFKRHTHINNDDVVGGIIGSEEDEEEEVEELDSVGNLDDDDDDHVGSVIGNEEEEDEIDCVGKNLDDDDDDDDVVRRKRGGNGNVTSADESDSVSSDDSSDYYDENDGDHLNEKAIWGKI